MLEMKLLWVSDHIYTDVKPVGLHFIDAASPDHLQELASEHDCVKQKDCSRNLGAIAENLRLRMSNWDDIGAVYNSIKDKRARSEKV
ncbi:hypothetical protein PC128_g24344 [Phytophthora cactorum]|nr:hypothetical protein PC128_g24344 [Phytophthora cactorum]KAG4040271.1 hypothetical protein PC123_g24187 [Phytophthora cactorum]